MSQLTHQEQKIVALIAQGLTNKEIAQRLGSSPFTVRNQVRVIIRKLELKNRVQVAYLRGQQANTKPEPAETGEYQFPNYERVARLRHALESQTGIPAAAILKELDAQFPVQVKHQPHRQLQPRVDGNTQHTETAGAVVPGDPPKPRHQRREHLS